MDDTELMGWEGMGWVEMGWNGHQLQICTYNRKAREKTN